MHDLTPGAPEPEFTVAHPCPSYCSLDPGHPADHDRWGRPCREHGGPLLQFGEYLTAGAHEYLEAPGLFLPSVQLHAEAVELRAPEALLELSRQLLSAAEWLLDNPPDC